MIDIKREEPNLRLDKGAAALLSGLEQTMQLSLTIGSYKIASVSYFKKDIARVYRYNS